MVEGGDSESSESFEEGEERTIFFGSLECSANTLRRLLPPKDLRTRRGCSELATSTTLWTVEEFELLQDVLASVLVTEDSSSSVLSVVLLDDVDEETRRQSFSSHLKSCLSEPFGFFRFLIHRPEEKVLRCFVAMVEL